MRTARRFVLAAVALAAAAPVQVAAQAHAQHTASPAVMSALGRDVQSLEQKIIGLAEAIPEEKWSWRPADGVRSTSEVMTHIIAENYFLPTYAGTTPPAESAIKADDYATVQAYEARKMTKAQALTALRESFAHLRRSMEGTNDAFLSANVKMFGMDMSGVDMWVLTTTHLHEHLGQLIAYARANDVVPPWSR